ncbi:MAG: M48 family metallopeptidase [Clostridia bacterium]|nr:M48 family metallopeptidase [Clostridia bacterium]
MEYKLVREKRKTLIIKILDSGEVLVKSPKKCSNNYINNFVFSKQKWIQEKVALVKQSLLQNKAYFNLESLLIFGKSYKVIDDKKTYKIGDYLIKHSKSNNKSNCIKKFLFTLANNYIIDRCQVLAKKLDLKYKDVKIISSRQKWGSCNSLKQLRFNFRLMCLPQNLIDYVICHELCHIKQLNHSKAFWLLLEELGYKKHIIKNEFKPYAFVLKTL